MTDQTNTIIADIEAVFGSLQSIIPSLTTIIADIEAVVGKIKNPGVTASTTTTPA
jgi:hypothetical protein